MPFFGKLDIYGIKHRLIRYLWVLKLKIKCMPFPRFIVDVITIRLLKFNQFVLSNKIAWIQSYEFSKRFATFFLVGGSIYK